MAKQAGGQRHGTDRSARARRPVSIFFNHGDGDVVNLKMMTCQTIPSAQKKQCREIKIKKRAEVAGSRPDRHGPGRPGCAWSLGVPRGLSRLPAERSVVLKEGFEI